jgi:tetratricopeptide (TPR) repeat protein/thiol-disulfide isomerase/thioredoxin
VNLAAIASGALPLGLTAIGLVFAGCTPTRAAPSPSPAASSVSASSPSASSSAAPGGDASVVFVENDYARALAEARSRGVPLFVDAWAPWCHTCLSMRAYVFPDAALRPLAGRFVWLALDTEREENAAVVERLGAKVLPTLYVVDPASEVTRLAHPGSLTPAELVRVLEPLAGAEPGRSGADGSAVAPGSDAPEAIAERVRRLADAKRLAACVTAGADAAPRMPPGTPLADVLRAALGCANGLPARAPERARLAELADVGQRVVADPTQPILADDRSDLYDYVVDALRELGREGDARRLAGAWIGFLEERAARAPSPAARAVFDAHRLLAYEAVGEPARALPMLEESARDFPGDYNPPARLGRALFDLKRYDESIGALERALGLAYGPRKLHLWSLEADVFLAKGDPAGARRALENAVAFAKTAPLTGGYPAFAEALARRLASMDAARPSR